MAQKTRTQAESLYGTPQPLQNRIQDPILSNRDPTTADLGYSIGQQWINKSSHTVFELANTAAGVASWATLGTLTSTYTTLTATNFVTGTAATALTLNGNTLSGTGSNAAISINLTPKGSGVVDVTAGDLDVAAGNVAIQTAGKGLQVKEGSNARMGQATLVAGTVTVSNTSVTANTRIFISRASPGGTPGALGTICVGTVTPSTSFVINSLDPTDGTTVVTTDVSDVNWFLVEKI